MNTVTPSIGSGLHRFRGQNHLQGNHQPALLVAVSNFEDASAAAGIGVSGITIQSGTPMNLTPYYSGLQGRRAIALYNAGAFQILLGPSGFTAQNGYPINPGTEKAFSIGKGIEIWAMTSGTAVSALRIMEIG